jgi:hypothetical protein
MWYVLDENHEPVPEPDSLKGAEFFNSTKRIVLQHEVEDSFVSTVFLCINHGFGDGPPVLFETLVQGGPLDDHMERYHTWSEAVAGHMSILRILCERLGKPFPESANPLPPRLHRTRYDHLLEDALDEG